MAATYKSTSSTTETNDALASYRAHTSRLIVGGQSIPYVRIEHGVLQVVEALGHWQTAELAPLVVRRDSVLPAAHNVERAQVSAIVGILFTANTYCHLRSKHAFRDGGRHAMRALDSRIPEAPKDRVNTALEEQLVGLEDAVTEVERSLRDALTVLAESWILLLDTWNQEEKKAWLIQFSVRFDAQNNIKVEEEERLAKIIPWPKR